MTHECFAKAQNGRYLLGSPSLKVDLLLLSELIPQISIDLTEKTSGYSLRSSLSISGVPEVSPTKGWDV